MRPEAEFVITQLARGLGTVSRRLLSSGNRPRVERAARRAVEGRALGAPPTRAELLHRVEGLVRQAVAFSLGLREGDTLIVRDRNGGERTLQFDDLELPSEGSEAGWRTRFERAAHRDIRFLTRV